MKYLLDTCVLSELVKKNPDKKVIDWISQQREEDLYLSVLTLGEIQKGISKLSKSNKKESLIFWLQNDLRERFNSRIISLDDRIALKWGTIQGENEKIGKKLSVIDSLIASTAIVYDLTIVSRNEKDLIGSNCKIFNPWT